MDSAGHERVRLPADYLKPQQALCKSGHLLAVPVHTALLTVGPERKI